MTLQISHPPIAGFHTGRDNCRSAEERLKKTLFIVEASSFEQHVFWRDFAHNSTERRFDKSVAWEQINPGWSVQVGEIGKLPICVSVSWARLDGHYVCFYEVTSRASDSEIVDKWFDKHFKGRWDSGTRRAQCDASNFHLCLQAVAEANTPKEDRHPDLPWVEEEVYFDRIRGLREQGKKIVVLDTKWGPPGADNPTMHYKFKIENEDPIEKGPYYTELETPRLLELAARIRPVFRPKGGSDLYFLKEHPLTIEYLRETAFLWDAKQGEKAGGLSVLYRFKSYHSWAYYGNFKPDIAETLAQIPAEYLDRVVAFEITEPKLNGDQEAFEAGYHTATCILYYRHIAVTFEGHQ